MPNDDRRDMVCLTQEVSMHLLTGKAIDPALEWNCWPRNIMTAGTWCHRRSQRDGPRRAHCGGGRGCLDCRYSWPERFV